MDDPSIDVSRKTREEIVVQLQDLGLNINQTNTARLKNQLKKALMEQHPIHTWLTGLTNEDVKQHFKLIYPNAGHQNSNRKRKEIAPDSGWCHPAPDSGW